MVIEVEQYLERFSFSVELVVSSLVSHGGGGVVVMVGIGRRVEQ